MKHLFSVAGADNRRPADEGAPEGEVSVTVPPKSQSGNKLRVRGKGIPATKKRSASDLIIHLLVRVPEEVEAPEATTAVEALEKFYRGDVRAKLAL